MTPQDLAAALKMIPPPEPMPPMSRDEAIMRLGGPGGSFDPRQLSAGPNGAPGGMAGIARMRERGGGTPLPPPDMPLGTGKSLGSPTVTRQAQPVSMDEIMASTDFLRQMAPPQQESTGGIDPRTMNRLWNTNPQVAASLSSNALEQKTRASEGAANRDLGREGIAAEGSRLDRTLGHSREMQEGGQQFQREESASDRLFREASQLSGQGHAEKLQGQEFGFRGKEGELGRQHATNLTGMELDARATEGAAGRKSARELAFMQERGQNTRQGNEIRYRRDDGAAGRQSARELAEMQESGQDRRQGKQLETTTKLAGAENALKEKMHYNELADRGKDRRSREIAAEKDRKFHSSMQAAKIESDEKIAKLEIQSRAGSVKADVTLQLWKEYSAAAADGAKNEAAALLEQHKAGKIGLDEYKRKSADATQAALLSSQKYLGMLDDAEQRGGSAKQVTPPRWDEVIQRPGENEEAVSSVYEKKFDEAAEGAGTEFPVHDFLNKLDKGIRHNPNNGPAIRTYMERKFGQQSVRDYLQGDSLPDTRGKFKRFTGFGYTPVTGKDEAWDAVRDKAALGGLDDKTETTITDRFGQKWKFDRPTTKATWGAPKLTR